MSDTTAGLLQVGAADRRPGRCATARSATTWPASTPASTTLARRAGRLPRGRGRPDGRAALAGLRRVRCSPSPRSACWSCTRCSGSSAPAAVARASPASTPDQAFNTAASFVTNTNWQSYSGESTMGHLVQMAGLAVQNFVSAAVGIAVAVALVRGFARVAHRPARQLLGRPGPRQPCASCCRSRSSRRRRADRAGRGPELLRRHRRRPPSPGGTQTITGGPVASQEAIKELGTNGGGFYNANSAHPFENPNALHQPASRSSCCC